MMPEILFAAGTYIALTLITLVAYTEAERREGREPYWRAGLVISLIWPYIGLAWIYDMIRHSLPKKW